MIFATGEATPGHEEGVDERFGRPCFVKPFELQTLVDFIAGAKGRPAGDDVSPFRDLGSERLTDH